MEIDASGVELGAMLAQEIKRWNTSSCGIC